MKLILASSSKQRQDILDMMGLKYEIVTSLVEEDSNQVEPDKYVTELSLNKANSVSKQIDYKAIIIAADTIIYCNNKIYEKPKNKEQASNNLKELSGKVNQAYTGISIIDLYQGKKVSFSAVTDIKFRKIDDDEINWYVNNEERVYKCCGYVPSGKASIFIENINGDYNNLLGLSPYIVFSKLKELGYNVSDFEFNKN